MDPIWQDSDEELNQPNEDPMASISVGETALPRPRFHLLAGRRFSLGRQRYYRSCESVSVCPLTLAINLLHLLCLCGWFEVWPMTTFQYRECSATGKTPRVQYSIAAWRRRYSVHHHGSNRSPSEGHNRRGLNSVMTCCRENHLALICCALDGNSGVDVRIMLTFAPMH